jgi:hypothetical protein
MKNEMEQVVNEVTALMEHFDSRNLKVDIVLSVLISTTMTVANRLGLPDDLLTQVLAEAQVIGKEMLADDQTMH